MGHFYNDDHSPNSSMEHGLVVELPDGKLSRSTIWCVVWFPWNRKSTKILWKWTIVWLLEIFNRQTLQAFWSQRPRCWNAQRVYRRNARRAGIFQLYTDVHSYSVYKKCNVHDMISAGCDNQHEARTSLTWIEFIPACHVYCKAIQIMYHVSCIHV